MNSHEVFIHIRQGCFVGTGAIVRLPQCQWSKPDGYGKISQCITTTKHSKAKTVCVFLGIYCIFVLICMFSDKACSLICRAWLCYTHMCTFLPLLSLPWPKTIGMDLNRSMQSPGKITVPHSVTIMCDALMALGNEESTSYLLGFQTTHVKGGSRSSHLFFTIKATCPGCAWFDWDTQVCIQAIGTRDVSSKWVNKYAFDSELSPLSTSAKTGAQQVTCSFPVLESNSCIWIWNAWVKYLFWGDS